MKSVQDQQHLFKWQVGEICTEWRTLTSIWEDCQLNGQFESVRFKQNYDKLVDKTRKLVRNMQGPQRVFGNRVDSLLDKVLEEIRVSDDMECGYRTACKKMVVSLEKLQYGLATATTLDTQNSVANDYLVKA